MTIQLQVLGSARCPLSYPPFLVRIYMLQIRIFRIFLYAPLLTFIINHILYHNYHQVTILRLIRLSSHIVDC